MHRFQVYNKNLGWITVKVSDEDRDLAARSWHLAGGKVTAGQAGKYVADSNGILLHREVAFRMGLISSVAPEPGQQGRWNVSIDHENGDKLDCRRSNLKLKDRSSQMLNPADGARSTSKSGIRGVIHARPGRSKPWNVQATLKGKNYNLGWFVTQEEAIEQRRAFDNASDKQAWLDNLLASRVR
jgi:hypothetical protein